MNWSEQHAAAILLERLNESAVVVGDGEYDSSRLYDIAASKDSGLFGAGAAKRCQGHRPSLLKPAS